MATFKGFWSYVHADNNAEGERIVRLARDVKEQFQVLTGEELSLFLDKDAIEWGKNWREAIDSNLETGAFFIPVMTPRYFMSPECRRELHTFARRATDLGMLELILPLYYVDVPEINNSETADELIKLVNTFQREDWRDLRFTEITSEAYRRAVAKLAARLVEANKQAEQTSVPIPKAILGEVTDEDLDESPGFIDQIATAEETLLQWPDTLKSITQEISSIGAIMKDGTDDIQRADNQGMGFSARLVVARKIASRISDPTEKIWALSNKFASQVHDVDAGIRTIIEHTPKEISENPESKDNFCNFFGAINQLNNATNYALENIQGMINSIEPIEKLSKDMRPILRRLKQGLTIMVESMDVSGEWINLINETGIACEEINIETAE
jgi:hypothetical protein